MDAPLRPPTSVGSPAWNSVFNWTWSYRQDADIWEPVGTLRRSDKVKPITYFKEVAKGKNTKKPVAWFASSCNVPSRRERYVQDLQKYIHVDVYGQCGNLTCPKSFACLEMLTKKYFFYLSFENAICRDHVTNKFFDLFYEDVHVIPVVLGGADYGKVFAEGTYVDTSWFQSPKQLADFLNFLMEDKKLYSEFLWRKSHFVFAGSGTNSALCQLCQQLHSLNDHRKTMRDLYQWYRTDQCRAPSLY